MGGKRVIAVAAGSVLMLAATSVVALAHGFGGGGGHDMWLLARAAGLNQTQIMSAFKNDPNLKTDRASLKSMHDTMMSCLVSPPQQGDCSSQITAFSNALQAMAQERMMVWQGLFKTAPTPSRAASVYSQLQQLRSSRKQIFQSVFSSQGAAGAPASGTTSPNG